MILVTGAAGLLGRAVLSHLSLAGKPVRAVDRMPVSDDFADRVDFRTADLRDIGQILRHLDDVKDIVHLAAWPTPHATDPNTVWSDNVVMSANMIAAAMQAKVDRFVYASSQSVLGLAWSNTVRAPDYLPIDEVHPCRPDDLYSMSKLAGEQLTELLAKSAPVSSIAMRFPVIWDHREFDRAIANRISNPQQGAKSQWAYADARDAACAVACALDATWSGYECVNIASQHAFLPDGDIMSAVRKWYPGLSWTGSKTDNDAAAFSSLKAFELFGFESRYNWRPEGIFESRKSFIRSGHHVG